MFKEALIEICERIGAARSRGALDAYALIGGLAVAARGLPRGTDDIDFAVESSDPEKLAELLGGTYEAGGPGDPLQGVIRKATCAQSTPVNVQLILLPQRLSRIVFSDQQAVDLYGHEVPVASWRSLVLLKLYAGSPQDLIDAGGILEIQRPSDADMQDLEQTARALGLSQEFAAAIRTQPKGKDPL